MRVLVVGSGGREHALAWAISASPLVDRLFCAPGNAGIAEEAECIAIGATDIKALVEFCRGSSQSFQEFILPLDAGGDLPHRKRLHQTYRFGGDGVLERCLPADFCSD